MEEIARDHINTLTSNVSQFRADDAYCDIEIHVEDSVFKCHRLILAAACQYFHNKFKENSSASEVTLSKDVVQPQVFGEILQFIYTGKVSIDNRNLYQLVRTSDFFELPSLAKLCCEYARQNGDAVLVQDGLAMFSYTRATGKQTFSEVIGQYICKNLNYFSKTREFLEISYENFIAILSLIPRSASTTSQDVYMYAIMRWIRNTNRSPRDMKLYFHELLKRINFVRLSSDCVEDLIRMNIDDLIALRQYGVSNDDLDAIDSEMKESDDVDLERLHVYVNIYSDDNTSEFVTSVYSFRGHAHKATADNRQWVNSYRFDCTNSHRSMRTVVLDGSLYCLSFSTAPHPREVSQIFRKSSCVSLCSNSYLKPPPLILDYYDMCGRGKHIYVYKRRLDGMAGVVPSCPPDTSFDQEQLSRGIYLYDREVDIWLPLPPLKVENSHACLTCDEQMVYLIGGRRSDKYVQGYDHRTAEWITLPSTNSPFVGAACCTHQKKIYVSGGVHNKFMEMYDPVAGKWQRVEEMKFDRSNHRIGSFLHSDYLVTAGSDLTRFKDVELYDVVEDEWMSMSSLYQSVMDSDPKLDKKNNRLEVIDMVTFRL